MNATRSLLRVHAHAWLVIGFALLVFFSFVYLKVLQVVCELQVDKAQQSHVERMAEAWARVASRRLDDPSLWAVLAAGLAAWLLTRGAAHYSSYKPLPDILWTRSARCWLWFLGMFVLSLGSYLTVIGLKQEGFWYGCNPDTARYHETLVPLIQTIEASLNVALIVLTCTLVPLVRTLVTLTRVGSVSGKTPPPLQRARARLATMAVGPFGMLASAFILYKIFTFVALTTGTDPIRPVDAALDIATGIVGAFIVCSPMIFATVDLWLRPRRNEISLKPLSGIGLLIWIGICVWRIDIVPVPIWLIDEDQMPDGLSIPWKVLNFFGLLGSGVFLWHIP